MKHATNYALRGETSAAPAWAVVGTDVVRGAMATARLVFTLAGCVALVGAAALLADHQTRERLAAVAPALVAAVWPQSAEALNLQDSEVLSAAIPPAAVDATAEMQQRNMTQYLSRRYRVADDAVRILVAAAHEAGGEFDLDPSLILAVMAIESALNPFAQSPVGAQGLMQVMTSVHTEKFEPHGGEHAALDPIANIKVGATILKDLIRRGGSVERGLQLYVGAGNLPDDGGYGARVLAERSRIRLAAAGRVDAAVVAAIRAGAQAQQAAAGMQPTSASLASPSASGAGGGMVQAGERAPATKPRGADSST